MHSLAHNKASLGKKRMARPVPITVRFSMGQIEGYTFLKYYDRGLIKEGRYLTDEARNRSGAGLVTRTGFEFGDAACGTGLVLSAIPVILDSQQF